MSNLRSLLAALLLVLLSSSADAGERFAYAPFSELAFEADPPALAARSGFGAGWWLRLADYEPYAMIDGGGEVFLEYAESGDAAPAGLFDGTPWSTSLPGVVLRTEAAGALAGTLYYPKADLSGFTAHRFRIATPTEGPAARERFYLAMEAYYGRLVTRDLPGAAWFRHRLREARAQIAGREAGDARDPRPTPWATPHGEFDDTFDLFTGERAIAENLELDRVLRPAEGDEAASVAIADIPGIRTRELDWKALAKDLKPELDPLARFVPADQHALFFPSFAEMTRVFDEADSEGSPLLAFASGRASDEQSKQRYQEQLCMPLSALARAFGPAIVAGVALTGSDPFLPSGTDVALLFECKQPLVFEKYLMARHLEAKAKGAEAVEGTIGKLHWGGVRTDDRRVCSYTASIDGVLVVTNSLVQLERIAATIEGRTPALAGADEYRWFRNRYVRGAGAESGFLVLTDATIRRWADPHWRIGESRRVRAAAAMSEIQAASLVALVQGKLDVGKSAADARWPITADFVWAKDGVASPTYGSLAFLTPIVELSFDKVTAAEQAAYVRFREAYQRSWSNYFDPIAVRLSLDDQRLGADVTVMPLQVSSEYNEFMRLTRGAKLAPTAGDPHASALFHFALAFGSDNGLGQILGELTGPASRQFGADPLSWIGGGVAIYGEKDAFWDELAQAGSESDFLEENFYRLPLALHVDVKDPLKMAAFLTAVRAFSDQSAPGIAKWTTVTWHDQPYVRIALEENVDVDGAISEAALYYVALPKALVLSLREDLIQGAIDRLKSPGDAAAARPWLGESIAMRADRSAFDMLSKVMGTGFEEQRRVAAWAPLPILGEWKRMFPDRDPVELHQRVWRQALAAPGDGYAWSAPWSTMASNLWGSPAEPKQGPSWPPELDHLRTGDFGLTFENDGLRARVEVTREPRK